MSAWTTALTDLRTLLSDGPQDKFRWRKPVFPAPNGVIKAFKTFELRRISNLTSATAPEGVYINQVLLPGGGVASDDLPSGEFSLVVAPHDGDTVEVSYYTQWFIDSELTSFLISASEWLLLADQFIAVPDGLKPAAKKYAASEAYLKLAMKWSERYSEQYRVEDSQDPKVRDAVKSYVDLASTFKKEASALRDEYYTRSGQSKQPLFSTSSGRARAIVPRG